jgi:hypothetical protein
MTVVTALIVSSVAHADECRSLGVGKDRGGTVSIAAVARAMSGPLVPVQLELTGSEARLVARTPDESAAPTPGAPGLFLFEGGARESWMPAEGISSGGTIVFLLDASKLQLLSARPLTQMILPIGSERGLVAGPDKVNQETLQAGARCVASELTSSASRKDSRAAG